MKIYPHWSSFPIDTIIYGVSAPYVGCGVYTVDGKYSWPDRDCTTKSEYERWANHLKENGYEIPNEYLNAYIEFKPDAIKESD